MKHWIMILAMTVLMPLVMACGGDSDEPNGPNGGGSTGSGSDEKPDTSLYVPRKGITDGNNSVFLEKGKIVEANTNFTKSDLENALGAMNWKRKYYIAYDQNYISAINAFTDYRKQIPTYLINGEAKFNELNESEDSYRRYKIYGKGFIVDMDWVSNRFEPAIKYTIVALDLSDSTCYIITDRTFPLWSSIPRGLDSDSTKIRIVWERYNPE